VGLLALVLTACGGGGTSIPPATRAVFPNLPTLTHIARRAASGESVHEALVYSTTRLSAFRAGTGANPKPPNQRVDVIVLEGQFVCQMCSPPAGAPAPRGHVETFVFVPGRGVEDFGLVRGPPGPQMGRAYALPIK